MRNINLLNYTELQNTHLTERDLKKTSGFIAKFTYSSSSLTYKSTFSKRTIYLYHLYNLILLNFDLHFC